MSDIIGIESARAKALEARKARIQKLMAQMDEQQLAALEKQAEVLIRIAFAQSARPISAQQQTDNS